MEQPTHFSDDEASLASPSSPTRIPERSSSLPPLKSALATSPPPGRRRRKRAHFSTAGDRHSDVCGDRQQNLAADRIVEMPNDSEDSSADFSETARSDCALHGSHQADEIGAALTENDARDDGPIGPRMDEQDAPPGTELDLVMPVVDEPPSTFKTTAHQRSPQHASPPANPRRLSEDIIRGRHDPEMPGSRRRASSMTDFQKLKDKLKFLPFATKSTPADCAITACSVRVSETPRLNTVYEHPAVQHERDAHSMKTAQTVASGCSTYQMVWEEPSRSASGSETTLIDEPGDLEALEDESEDYVDAGETKMEVERCHSPMGKVRTKLAAWSWAREQQDEDEGEGRGIPLLPLDAEERRECEIEDPPAPPNTEKTSALSSARHSGPVTPREPDTFVPREASLVDDGDDTQVEDEAEEEDQPIELQFRSAFHRIRSLSMPANGDYLTVPSGNSSGVSASPWRSQSPMAQSRHLSNLAAEEENFTGHRDSMDLNHRRMNEERMNAMLMGTRDSFVLAKGKYEDRYPASNGQWSRFGGLSPIPDASPPDAGGWGRRQGRAAEGSGAHVTLAERDGPQPEPELEREPEKVRWYKAKYTKGGAGGEMRLVLTDEEIEE